MQAEYLLNKAKTHNYVKGNKDCKVLITNAQAEMSKLDMMHGPSSDSTHLLSRLHLHYAILFAVRGWSRGFPTNTMETYDSCADQWVNVSKKAPFLITT